MRQHMTMPIAVAIGITSPYGLRSVYARPFYVTRSRIIARHLKGVRPGWYIGLEQGSQFQVSLADLADQRKSLAIVSMVSVIERKNKTPFKIDVFQEEQAECLPGRKDDDMWRKFMLGGKLGFLSFKARAVVKVTVYTCCRHDYRSYRRTAYSLLRKLEKFELALSLWAKS